MRSECLRFSNSQLGEVDPGPVMVEQGFAYGANLIVPGIGILIGFALKALFSDSNDTVAIMQHFDHNVMGPVVRAVAAKDFVNATAIGLITEMPAAAEHIGYVAQNFPQILPAYFALASGNAIARLNPDRLMAFALLVDKLVYNGLKVIAERAEHVAQSRAEGGSE